MSLVFITSGLNQRADYDAALARWLSNNTGGGYTASLGAAAFSFSYIDAPLTDQSVRWYLTETTKQRSVGFSSRPNYLVGSRMEAAWEFSGTAFRVLESGTVKFTSAQTPAVGNELRVQIVLEGGVYKVKYYWRASNSTAEVLEYTSTLTDAQIKAMFPIHAKAEFYSTAAPAKFSLEDDLSATNKILTLNNTDFKTTGDDDSKIAIPLTIIAATDLEEDIHAAYLAKFRTTPTTGWISRR